jgi:hypothetical protein
MAKDNLYMYDLCMFIRCLVSIRQVLKDTEFGLHNLYESGKKRKYKSDKSATDIGLYVDRLPNQPIHHAVIFLKSNTCL